MKESGNKVHLGAKCGQCIHYKVGPPIPDNSGKVCSDMGVLKFASARSCFTPNHHLFTRMEDGDLEFLCDMGADLSAPQLRVLAYVFRNMAMLKKVGFDFGQLVYFNLSAPAVDYLDQYYKGYVIGLSKNREHIYISSALRFRGKNYGKKIDLTLKVSSVMSEETFITHSNKLIQSKKVRTPKRNKSSRFRHTLDIAKILKNQGISTEDIPSIDSVKLGANERHKLVAVLPDRNSKTISKKTKKKSSEKGDALPFHSESSDTVQSSTYVINRKGTKRT